MGRYVERLAGEAECQAAISTITPATPVQLVQQPGVTPPVVMVTDRRWLKAGVYRAR